MWRICGGKWLCCTMTSAAEADAANYKVTNHSGITQFLRILPNIVIFSDRRSDQILQIPINVFSAFGTVGLLATIIAAYKRISARSLDI